MEIDATWKGLPDKFKESVVKVLDFKSRCALKKCSVADYTMVDLVPINTRRLALTVYQRSIVFFIGPEKIEYFHVHPQDTRPMIIEYTAKLGDGPIKKVFPGIVSADLDYAVRDFAQAIQHVDASFDKVDFQFAEGINPERAELLSRKLVGQLNRMKPEWTLKAHCFYTNFVISGQTMLYLISKLDPHYLQHLRIKHITLNQNQVRELTNMSQWNNAQSLYVEEKTEIPVRCFSHVETFWTKTDFRLPLEAWNVIQNYIARNPPHGSYFYVESDAPINYARILDAGHVQIAINIIRTPWQDSLIQHSQAFNLATRNNVLLVLFMEHAITGRVCRTDSYVDDSMKFYTGYTFEPTLANR
ncbi:hypothetical protein GCK72_025685 [Caenorhabditis remanei]|uniref:DUF38 domain-containing protein n=1 Tax=Caenorhabditis remanei TaxID=31234 RepID=A0A6A5G2P3_CAERE|nr:hypothetical protein GCK72_025685 [Caenorhabditis remanei]KAF1749218.1 hypothetical protein GCK72_025685 [Caenorhabditis remanei]